MLWLGVNIVSMELIITYVPYGVDLFEEKESDGRDCGFCLLVFVWEEVNFSVVVLCLLPEWMEVPHEDRPSANL